MISKLIKSTNLQEKDPRIQKLLEIPGNYNCADCGIDNVKFLSMQFSVIICEKCAEVHKSIGSTIKPLWDKDWNEDLLLHLKQHTNTFAKENYEALKPSWFLTSSSYPDSKGIRENWIKSKYVEQAFIQKNNEENDTYTEEKCYNMLKQIIKDINTKKAKEQFRLTNWYYLEAAENEVKQIGPVPKAEILKLLNNEMIDESFYVWHPNLKTWEQIIDVAEFDLDNRSIVIPKEDHSFIKDIPIKMVKFVARSLRGYLEVTKSKTNNWKKYWVVLTNEAIMLYKSSESTSKTEFLIPIKDNLLSLDIYEIIKNKQNQTVFEISNLIFSAENSFIAIEWIHNIKKLILLKSKFENQLPLYEDTFNPYKTNIWFDEKEIKNYIKGGFILHRISNNSPPIKRWCDLLTTKLRIFEHPKDSIPKLELVISKDFKVSLIDSKTTAKNYFSFMIEIDKTSINIFDCISDIERKDWVEQIQSKNYSLDLPINVLYNIEAINIKKKEN